jgi:hypothetical protein
VPSVIAYRSKDARGTEILFELGQRLAAGTVQGVDMESFHWPLADRTARYHLVGDISMHSLEPELGDIDAKWEDHIERP